ncbi:MAG: hypothetical protein DRP08_06125, partial [Candidatus Aenigmatarchaeota archaeon]
MDDARRNEIIAVIFFALALFLFLSILSFNARDLSLYTSEPNAASYNLTGVAGSYTGGGLLFLMGGGAYVIPLLAFAWGLSRLFQLEPRKLFFKVFGTIFLVMAVSSSLSMINYTTRESAFARGGLIGTIVSSFLLEYLGKAGAVVVISATIILSILIATEFLLLPLVMATYRFLKSFFSGAMDFFAERRDVVIPKKTAKKPVISLREAKQEVSKKLESVRKQVQESRAAAARLKEEKAARAAVPQTASQKAPKLARSK